MKMMLTTCSSPPTLVPTRTLLLRRKIFSFTEIKLCQGDGSLLSGVSRRLASLRLSDTDTDTDTAATGATGATAAAGTDMVAVVADAVSGTDDTGDTTTATGIGKGKQNLRGSRLRRRDRE